MIHGGSETWFYSERLRNMKCLNVVGDIASCVH